ncbi:MAG: hypothetical protein GF308_22190 [Candidatus Heimdallarchaeota archaeon]|nr:hypothetical protein [Candidatus Heimdallarchaeota archaeon]
MVGNIIVTSLANFVQSTDIFLADGTLSLLIGVIGLSIFLSKTSLNCSDYTKEEAGKKKKRIVRIRIYSVFP